MSDTTTTPDLAARVEALEQRLAAIERAATPQPAPVEWPRYFRHHAGPFSDGSIMLRFDDDDVKKINADGIADKEPDINHVNIALNMSKRGDWIEVPRAEAEDRIAAARGEKPAEEVEAIADAPPFHVGQVVECVDGRDGLIETGSTYECAQVFLESGRWFVRVKGSVVATHKADRFRAIEPPAVDATPGMVAVETLKRYAKEYRRRGVIGWANVDTAIEVIAPELAALRAENVRLKDDYQVAVNNIGYRSEELLTANREIEQLKAERTEVEEAWGQLRRENSDLRQQLATVEAERETEKRRRVYYQDIVHDVCNQLDRVTGLERIVCGTVNEPTKQVRDALAYFIEDRKAELARISKEVESVVKELADSRQALDDIGRVIGCADHDASGYSRCVEQVISDLRASLAAAMEAGALQGHGEPCYYCGRECNSLAANPGLWPIPLCHADEPGVVKRHHIKCVSERLAAGEKMRTEIATRLKCIAGGCSCFQCNQIRQIVDELTTTPAPLAGEGGAS